MWICQRCGADVDADWDTCWNCATVREDAPDGQPEPASAIDLGAARACLRCQTPLEARGVKYFFEGEETWGDLLLSPGIRNVRRERFDLYACPRCGHAELFVEPTFGRGR